MPRRSLPDRPDLQQYKKQAKDLLNSVRASDADALRRVREHHPREVERFVLADAQLVIAREHGVDSWPKFVREIESRLGEQSPSKIWRAAERAIEDGDATTLEALLRDHGTMLRGQRPETSWWGGLAPDYSPADAWTMIAANNDFESWAQFEAFAAARKSRGSLV